MTDAEFGGTAGEARTSSTVLPVSSPCTSGFGDGNATAPSAPTAAAQAGKPRQAGTSRRERIAAAKQSELAAEALPGWDATIDSNLHSSIIQGLRVFLSVFDLPDVAATFCPRKPQAEARDGGGARGTPVARQCLRAA